MSTHVEWHDPTVADVRVTPPETTWDGFTPNDDDFDSDTATDAGHYALTIDCIENVAVFEGTPRELARLVKRITTRWAEFTATHPELFEEVR